VEQEGDQSVAEVEDGDGAEEGVPEPEDEVDLLVDDVLCEDTEAVVVLGHPGSSDVGDGAGGDGGEDGAHRVSQPQLRVISLLLGVAVVLHHLPAVQLKLVVEKSVRSEELEKQQRKVEKFAEDESCEIPRIVMKNRFEIFHEFLHHGLHHHSVVVHGVLTHHDGAFALRAKGCHEATLKASPHFVRQEEQSSLNSKHEGDPLIIRGIWGVIFALHPIKVDDTLDVRLVLGFDVGAAVDPTVILGHVGTDPLELTADWVSEILTGNAHRGSSHADDHGDFVVKLECPVVNVGLLQIKVVGEIRQDGSHGGVFLFFLSVRGEVRVILVRLELSTGEKN